MGLLAVAALIPLSTMATASRADTAVRQKGAAMRAGSAVMETVLAYDYGEDIDDFISHWSDAGNATFTAPELAVLAGADAQAVVTIDATDKQRIGIQVNVAWTHAGESRQLVLPMIMTGVVP